MDQVACWETPAEYMEHVQKKGMLLNAGILAGHGTLRIAASGLVTRVLTEEEQKLLERYLDECMEMGCFGLSTGLQYFPGLQSDLNELLGCGKVLKNTAAYSPRTCAAIPTPWTMPSMRSSRWGSTAI